MGFAALCPPCTSHPAPKRKTCIKRAGPFRQRQSLFGCFLPEFPGEWDIPDLMLPGALWLLKNAFVPDALRYALINGSAPGSDQRFQQEKIEALREQCRHLMTLCPTV